MTSPPTTDLVSERLGFGCGRLKGGSEQANAIRLVHTALDHGIRHFDTAPPYGLGTSESMLGLALKGRQEKVFVVTKAGLARPASPGLLQTARAIIKPLAARVPGLQKTVLRSMSKLAPPANFSPNFVEQSIELSLRQIQRDRIDCLLLHEAQEHHDLLSLHPLLDRYLATGRLGALGSSTGNHVGRLVRFGTVLQYRCPEPGHKQSPANTTDILHGAFRFIAPVIQSARARDLELNEIMMSLVPAGVQPSDANGILALAYALARYDNKLLFSTSQPQRLISTLRDLRHVTTRQNWRPAMTAMQAAIEG